MMRGRYYKLTRELPRAIRCFQRSMEVQHEWKPLVDMGMYESAFVHMFRFEMREALELWKKLLETNDWSKVLREAREGRRGRGGEEERVEG